MPLTHSQYHQSPKVARSPLPPSSKEPATPSLPGLTPQVGFTRLTALKDAQLGQARLAALKDAQLGQARVAVQSIHLRKNVLRRRWMRGTKAHSRASIARRRQA